MDKALTIGLVVVVMAYVLAMVWLLHYQAVIWREQNDEMRRLQMEHNRDFGRWLNIIMPKESKD